MKDYIKDYMNFTKKDFVKMDKKCKKCKYGNKTFLTTMGIICDYFEKTGELRNCNPVNCEKFERKGIKK